MARQPRTKPTPPPKPTPPEVPRESPFPVITGDDGDDILSDKLSWVREASTTNDRITGGAGNDNITSTGGVDFIDGGSGTDFATVFLDQFNTGLTVTGDIGSGKTATFSNGTVVTNVEQAYLIFGAGNDNITFASDQFIHAGDGNDRITLTAGNGIVDGGRGDDIITTGAGNDVLRGDYGNDVLKAGAGNDELSGGNDNDLLLGGDGNDALNGGFGNDQLEGGNGDDRLAGSVGVDTLIGGAGADRFVISADTFGGIDHILDFNYAQGDRIEAFFLIEDFVNVTNTLVEDPLADGFITVSQAANGVLVSLASDPSGGLLLLGASLNTLPTDFLI